MLSGWLHNLFYNDEEERNNVKILNKQVKDLYKPCVLTQGQRLHNNQAEKITALTPNLLAFNETVATPYANTSPFVNTNTYAQYDVANTYANGDRYSNAKTYATKNTYIKGNTIEGFGPMQTTAKNTADWQDTTNLSTDYTQKIDRYQTEYPSLIDHSRLYSQSTDRTTNYKENTRILNQDINMKYNITADKEGCYKQVPGSDLVYQSDMNDVTLDTCKKRTSDLAYAGFSVKTKADGQLGCYLTNNVAGNKTAGIATKSQTSLAFKTDKSANMGALLMNGQLGIFQDTKTLATDLTAVPGCNADGSKILINPDTITATWGGNCVNTIKSEFNNKCIDQSNGSKDPYLQMQMWDCGQGNPNQNMIYNNDSYTINVPGDNLCMDVLGAGTADGTKVIQYSCNGGTNQKWTYGMDKTLQPQHTSGKCLDVLGYNNANGAGLGIWDCNGGTNQKWDITRNGIMLAPIPPPSFLDTSKQYRLQSINTNNCVFNNSDGRFGIYQCSDYNDQYWIPFAVPGQQNTYMFKGVNSYYSLYADTNGQFSTAVSDINNPAQQWQLLPVSGQPDTYQLTNKKTNSCMINNVDGRFNMAGCVAAYNDQWWKITPIVQ
jgi:hypothetical protein